MLAFLLLLAYCTLPESLPLLGPFIGGILVEFLVLHRLTCSNHVSVFLMRLWKDADNVPAAPGVSVIDGMPAVASLVFSALLTFLLAVGIKPLLLLAYLWAPW
jgi:hypothetical protein